MWSLTLRQLRTRIVRTGLTVLSVAAAVAAVVAVVQAVASTRDNHRQLSTVLAGRADLEIVARGGGRFDQRYLELARSIPGIRVASPYLSQASTLFARPNRIRLSLLGIDPQTDSQIRQYTIVQGRNLLSGVATATADEPEVLIDRDSARRLGIVPGQTIRIITGEGVRARQPLKRLQVVGVFLPEGVSSAAEGVSLLLSLADAQRLFSGDNQIDAVRCVLDGSRSAEEVIADISRSLPGPLIARRPGARDRLAQSTQNTIDYSLILAGGLAVLAAGFILLNTFLISLQEQRGSVSLLRLVGMTSGQGRRLVLMAALPLGLAGTALGLPLGWLGGRYLTRTTEQVLQASHGADAGLTWGLLAGAIAGPVLTLLAALWPMRHSAGISPLESLRQAQGSRRAFRPLAVLAGVVLTELALAGLIGSMVGRLPASWFIPAALLALGSCMLLVPLWLGPLSQATAWLLRPLLGQEVVLACGQVTGPGVRNALAAGILFMATAAGVAVNNTSLNLMNGIDTWYHKCYPVQYFLRVMMPTDDGAVTPALPEALAEQVAAMEGVTLVDRIGVLRVNAGDQSALLFTRQFQPYPQLPLNLRSGDPADVRRRLLAGEVVLGGSVAHQLGLGPGDEIELGHGEYTRRFRIAGVVNEYLFGGQVILIEREFGERAFGTDRIDALMIATAPDAVDSVGKELRSLSDHSGLLLHSFSELGLIIDSITQGFRGGVYLLVAISFVLCSFGIVNTLTMNILEQGRELGLLRLVGMQRAGLCRLVLLQTVLLATCGIVPGVLAGLGLAWMINQASGRLFGNPVPYVLHPLAALTCGVAAFGLALASAWLPALRAARLDPLEAVRRG